MLTMNSNDPGDLYNISKLMGESLVLNDSRNGFRVARISNVVGPSQPSATFIGSLLNESSLNSKSENISPIGSNTSKILK